MKSYSSLFTSLRKTLGGFYYFLKYQLEPITSFLEPRIQGKDHLQISLDQFRIKECQN